MEENFLIELGKLSSKERQEYINKLNINNIPPRRNEGRKEEIVKDGWHDFKIGGEYICNIYIENGKVIRGTNKESTRTLYPYKSVFYAGRWTKTFCHGGIKYETFRVGYKKGTYDML